MRIITTAVAALSVALTVPVAAQAPGSVDFGLNARYTVTDRTMLADNAVGFGGRVGMFLLPNLALEFDVSTSKALSGGAGRLQPMTLQLAWHRRMGAKWSGIIGAGWARDRTDADGPGGPVSDDGYAAMLGLQRRMSDQASLRFDAIGNFLTSPQGQTSTRNLQVNNLALQAGINFRFGRRGALDTDKDGVLDAIDACPATPMGEMVDARGCVPPKDSDRDGVIDPNDRCANTPAGTRVDVNGCALPVDSDGDGVMDNNDRCANTPTGTRVDVTGCAVPVDSDRDGVLDSADRCPNTPVGTKVDGVGCPVPLDGDRDGVVDGSDACPNTAAGVRVDRTGCAFIFEEGRKTVVLEGVTFATGKAVLTPEATVVLDRVALALVNAPNVKVEVQGHTDSTGSAAINTRLSGLRAVAVRAYLASKGVDAARMTAKGYGPSLPVSPNSTAQGRAQNRRVELMRTN